MQTRAERHVSFQVKCTVIFVVLVTEIAMCRQVSVKLHIIKFCYNPFSVPKLHRSTDGQTEEFY